jgi:glycosyltransferase involved in cell wall biosynthesis
MKVAVATIALNEEANVREWLASTKGADYVLIADTGSTDNTSVIALHERANVINVRVNPWRFDIARNAAMAALPDWIDWVIWLDMDERLQPGWREALEQVPDEMTRIHFWYVWSWNEDGSPAVQFWRDFGHRRYGYHWRHPIHELITRYDPSPEVIAYVRGIEVHHFQDLTKARRGKYLGLLEMAVKEDPLADRMSTWLAREYLYAGRNQEAAAEFKRHIALPTAGWAAEVANSMYMLSKVEPENALHWLRAAEAKAPDRREHKVHLAKYYYDRKDWGPTLHWANTALAVTYHPQDYLVEPAAWGSLVWELKYMALYHLGLINEAIEAAEQALLIEPNDERIAGNLEMMRNLEPADS